MSVEFMYLLVRLLAEINNRYLFVMERSWFGCSMTNTVLTHLPRNLAVGHDLGKG